jgi:hypothetical protein
MNTLALCRRFFEAHGYPILLEAFPDVTDRIAAARIGGGSDVLGYDDEYSRQGEWGPTFQLFLPDEDYERIGPTIREVLHRKLPPEFEGFPTGRRGGPGVDVFGIHGYMRERLGISYFPQSQLEWLQVPESALCQFVRGEVFYDPMNELTGIRQRFAGYYPSDVWKLLLARAAYACWLYGEYNFPKRLAPRGDVVTGLIARGSFVDAAMRLVFLLNRRYAPNWKWIHREFTELPAVAKEIGPLLRKLALEPELGKEAKIVVQVCTRLKDAIRGQGLVGSEAKMDYVGAFDIMRTMEDVELARQPVRYY